MLFFIVISSLLFSQNKPAAPVNFIPVEGGSCMMGCEDGEDFEKPVHKITVSDFYINKYEVTQDEYLAIMGELPCDKSEGSDPVYNVSFDNALVYCNKRSIKEGRTPCYSIEGNTDLEAAGWLADPPECNFNANGYRLLTEAEWEYAARGGKLSKEFYFSGSNDFEEVAWCGQNAEGKVHPVGTKAPNELGIYDMSGNVFEWCWDKYDASFYETSPEVNPINRDGSQDLFRGGDINYRSGKSTVYYRAFYTNAYMLGDIGIRLAVGK